MEFVAAPFTQDDIIELVKLKPFFEEMWSAKGLLAELSNEASVTLVVRDGEKAVGFCAFSAVGSEASLNMLIVAPQFRGKGLAHLLLKEAIKKLKGKNVQEIFLEVRASNIKAIHLYEEFGFVKQGIRKEFYSNPTEDAQLMCSLI